VAVKLALVVAAGGCVSPAIEVAHDPEPVVCARSVPMSCSIARFIAARNSSGAVQVSRFVSASNPRENPAASGNRRACAITKCGRSFAASL